MQVVLLAGGLGTRLAEETAVKPKPMVEIGGKPILWHIMNVYSHFGYKDFVIACGYKGHVVKEYFHNLFIHDSDWVIDLRRGTREQISSVNPDWRVGLFDTGVHTATGGRLLRLRPAIGGATFMVTYGDGVGDIDIAALVAFHRRHGRLATITAVHPPARFGSLVLDGERVCRFSEKPQTEKDWINGGFFVFEPEVLDYIEGDDVPLERRPLEHLAADHQLMAFQHAGFWQPMDTLREKQFLEALWESGRAPWKLWKDREHESRRILPYTESPGHGPHGFQGGLANHVA